MTDEVVRIASLGFVVDVRVTDPETRQRLDELYASSRSTEGHATNLVVEILVDTPTGPFDLVVDGQSIVQCSDRSEMLDWLAWRVNTSALAGKRSGLVLHAGGAARAGRAVLVTGASGAGKSSLAAALTLSGFSYLGDDSVVLTEAGEIISNPKPVALDDASRSALLRMHPDNVELQRFRRLFAAGGFGVAVPVDAPVAPGLIVRASFRPDAETSVTALTAADTAVLLADQSFNFATCGAGGLRAVGAASRRARAIAVEFGDLASAVAAIISLLDGVISESVRIADAPSPTRAGLDIEMLDGQALIWSRATHDLHRLSESATAVWLRCSGAFDAASIAASIAATIDVDPAEVLVDVESCMADLARLGLIARPGTVDRERDHDTQGSGS